MMASAIGRLAVLVMLATFAACGNAARDDSDMVDPADDSVAAAGGAPSDALPTNGADTGPDTAVALLITSEGIGPVRAGMSLGELRRVLPASHALGAPDDAFMVDIVAVPVTAAGDTVYRLIFPAGEAVTDDALPHFVMTTHPRARTEDGIGPGSTLAEAARILGEPTLSYSIHDESREYAEFPRQPENVRCRVRPVSGSALFAGEYATNDEYNTTEVYDDDAQIWMVFVDLRAH